jgi:hypothetical protein
MLVLDTEEIIRLIIRQRLNHQRWQAYPGLIICCDLLVSLAVICTTFGFVYAQNSQYVWAVVHVATGGSSGSVLVLMHYSTTKLTFDSVLHLLLSLSGCVYCCNFNRKKSMPPGNRASPLRGPWDNAPLRR